MIVVASIASLNTIVTEVLTETPEVPAEGETERTEGDVVSGATAVVNAAENGDASAFPPASLTPVETVSV